MVDYDIIVVGGGLNGLTLASMLSMHDFKIALIDKSDLSKKIQIRDGRAIAISNFSQKILAKYQLWDRVSKHGAGEIHNILIQDADSSYSMEFNNHLVDNQILGFLVSSDEIAKGLYSKVLESKNITVIDNTECLEINSDLHLSSITLSSGKTIKAKLSVIADGKKSKGRELLNLPTVDKDYDQVCFVMNIKHSLSHKNYAYELFYRNGPFALLPLASQNESAVVWADKPAAKNIVKTNIRLFEEILQERCKDICGDIKITSAVNVFPLSLSFMNEYFKGRSVFIGDSLHFIHPIAGQGYNLSIRDINALINLLIEYRDLGVDIGSEALLEVFTRQRKHDNMLMIRITDGLNGIFANDSGLMSWGRKIGLETIDSLDILKRTMMQYAMGYKVDLDLLKKFLTV
ncbi:MAG: FAD-dependent monooxygenase [Rickettsiales bacterium]|nr:FAD-dependent monooxygenase [Rickettsiales bacterium]